jgi:hypothetical protein
MRSQLQLHSDLNYGLNDKVSNAPIFAFKSMTITYFENGHITLLVSNET